MPTITFLEPGTDATQDFSFWPTAVASGGTLTSDTTAHTGARAIKSTIAVAGDASYALAFSPAGILADAGRAISCWVRFSSVTPDRAGAFLFAMKTSVALLGVGITTSGTLCLSSYGCFDVSTGATVLQANTWYRLTLSYVIASVGVWTAKLYLNGAVETIATQAQGNMSTTGSDTLAVGLYAVNLLTFTSVPVMTVWIDDLYVDDRTDLTDPGADNGADPTDSGAMRVTAKRPIANGSANNFGLQIGIGGSGYGTGHAPQVNEQPLSTTNGWSVAAAAATTEKYLLETQAVGDVDLTGRTIRGIQGWVYAKALLDETAQIVLNGVSTPISLTSTPTLFTKVAATAAYPAGQGSDIGMVTDATVTTVSLYECGVLVAYSAPPVPSNDLMGACCSG